MSNNAGVGLTTSGLGELGRAQILQAQAARVAPHVDMNPVLLKPASDRRSQVVVLGDARGDQEASAYFRDTSALRDVAYAAYDRLAARFHRIVLEGAGSCAEVNLRDRDFVNFEAAHHANARVVLVADIDRGGVYAQVVGTLACLDDRDRARIVGVIVNNFRGDAALFDDGRAWLVNRTGLPVLGVLPHLRGIGLESEDSLPSDVPLDPTWDPARVRVGVLRLPRIANFTDALTLSRFPDQIQPAFLTNPALGLGCDLLVVPGTKNTRADLAWLHASGWADVIRERVRLGKAVIGVCGGYQMLGRAVSNPEGVEDSPGTTAGIGVLDATTVFERGKRVTLARGLLHLGSGDEPVAGYEIHVGRTPSSHRSATSLGASLTADGTAHPDGAYVSDRLWGTYLHGVLDEPRTLCAVLQPLRPDVDLSGVASAPSSAQARDTALDRLAAHVLAHVDLDVAVD